MGELLAGKRLEETEMKEQADAVILESLNYSGRMAAGMVKVLLLLLGLALLLSPLVSASRNYVWIAGIAITAAAVLCFRTGKKGDSVKARNRLYYGAAMVLQGAALILEILPVGAVMVFATGPEERITETYSYFSLLALGYANVTPMLTGILTIAVLFLGWIAVFRFDKTSRLRKTVFIGSGIAFLLSVVPLFLFGAIGMTAASYAVSGMIFLSVCLQAVANRNG